MRPTEMIPLGFGYVALLDVVGTGEGGAGGLTPSQAKTERREEHSEGSDTSGIERSASRCRFLLHAVWICPESPSLLQAALVKFEVRLTAMMVRQLAEFWLAFSGRRERSRPEVAREIERKVRGQRIPPCASLACSLGG